MEIKFLGTGGAFEPEYYNSAALISVAGKKLLIDAGFTVYPRLVKLNLVRAFDYILITHLHNDHSGSLANLLLHRNILTGGQKFTILYPDEKFKAQLQDFLTIQLKDPEKYADFASLEKLPGLTALDTFGRHSEGFQSYSYIFEEAGERLVYSGDLQDTDFLFRHLQSLPPLPTTVFHDLTFDPENSGHTHFSKLQPYLPKYRIFGYHCDPTQNLPENPIDLVYDQTHLRYDL